MIIGIAGSFGAGKGVAVEYLKKKGFKHYSTSGVIREEILRRGLEPNRDSYIVVGNDLRSRFGPAYLVDVCYDRAIKAGGDAVIESLRAVAEAKKIKELGGLVIGIDATPETRYRNIVVRGGEKDHVTFEKWLEQEKSETNPDDPTKQDIFGALNESNVIIENNGSFEELYEKIEHVL